MNQQLIEELIKDQCDIYAENVINTFRMFVSVCGPITHEQLEDMAFDAMEIWECA